jgi:hypothetical protein
VHANSAFALVLALEFAHITTNAAFAAMLKEKAIDWYNNDANCQAWEPCGDDFLSSALIEAACMRAVLGREDFARWFAEFLPGLSAGKIAHLDGLNLSRAWCWRLILDGVSDSAARSRIEETISHHLESALPHVTGDYMGEHWLATFALLALDCV